jgi:hypothetical protein
VAIGTFIAGLRVIITLTLRKVVVVATGAGRGHTFKNSALMAFFAGDGLVCAFEGKLCLAVIEILINLYAGRLGLGIGGHSDEPKARDKNHDDLQHHMKPANFQIFSPAAHTTGPSNAFHRPITPQPKTRKNYFCVIHHYESGITQTYLGEIKSDCDLQKPDNYACDLKYLIALSAILVRHS